MAEQTQQQQAGAASKGPRVFHSDAIQRLASTAPCWCIIISADCREYVPSMQVIEPSRLVEMFVNKVLSRSTCLAGLMDTTRPLLNSISHIPAAFFRTLEFLLEMNESGIAYRPITLEELTAGAPAPDWCLPLHMQVQRLRSGPEPVRPQVHMSLEALALAAVSVAPSWCLIHKYHLSDAKFDFNWPPRDLASGLLNRSISPYTLVLGFGVRKERNTPWMRSCMFVPLEMVLHQHQSGYSYTPLTRNDLHTFNTLGFRGALTASPEPPLTLPMPLSAAMPIVMPIPSSSGGGSGMAGPSGVARDTAEVMTAVTTAIAESPVITVLSERERVIMPGGRHSSHSGSGSGSRSGSGGLGLSGFNLNPTPGSQEGSAQFATPLMRLMSATGPGQAPTIPPSSQWWLLDSAQVVMQGPLTMEQVLIAYCRGIIQDSMYLCGTMHSNVTPPVPPPVEWFQSLEVLLTAIQQGAVYNLMPAPATHAAASAYDISVLPASSSAMATHWTTASRPPGS